MEHPHSAQHCVLLCRVASKACLPPVEALSVLHACTAGLRGMCLRRCAVSRRARLRESRTMRLEVVAEHRAD